jgi:3-oxoacyl-[acyl-carrier protein] reductase
MCEISPTFYEKNKVGVIVNIGSIGGHAYLDCLVPYCASKGGVNLTTKSLAVELAQYNIRVNAVSPGTVSVKRNFITNPNYPDNW